MTSRFLATRAKVCGAIGLVAVPLCNYYVPVLPEVSAALLALLLVRLEPSRPFVALGLARRPPVFRTLAIGATCGGALFLMNHLVVLPVIALMIQTPRNLHVFDYLRGNELAVMKLLPAIWLTAGVCEEIIYRGYLITTVAGLLGGSRVATFVGCVIAAVVFGLAHDYQGLAGMLSTGVVGLMLGTLYIAERRNLWTNIVAHAVGDTISLLAIFASLDRPLDDFARRMSLGL